MLRAARPCSALERAIIFVLGAIVRARANTSQACNVYRCDHDGDDCKEEPRGGGMPAWLAPLLIALGAALHALGRRFGPGLALRIFGKQRADGAAYEQLGPLASAAIPSDAARIAAGVSGDGLRHRGSFPHAVSGAGLESASASAAAAPVSAAARVAESAAAVKEYDDDDLI